MRWSFSFVFLFLKDVLLGQKRLVHIVGAQVFRQKLVNEGLDVLAVPGIGVLLAEIALRVQELGIESNTSSPSPRTGSARSLKASTPACSGLIGVLDHPFVTGSRRSG
jgi:hypothetical protein